MPVAARGAGPGAGPATGQAGRRGAGDVVFVLLLMQAAAGLLAGVGEVALMGMPWYAVLPVVRAAVLFLLAGKVAKGRRRALVAVLVLQWLGLLGVWLGLLLGVVPGLAPSLTLAGLLTEVGLPVAVTVLCAGLLAGQQPAGRRSDRRAGRAR